MLILSFCERNPQAFICLNRPCLGRLGPCTRQDQDSNLFPLGISSLSEKRLVPWGIRSLNIQVCYRIQSFICLLKMILNLTLNDDLHQLLLQQGSYFALFLLLVTGFDSWLLEAFPVYCSKKRERANFEASQSCQLDQY
jgi:hypothetical protein